MAYIISANRSILTATGMSAPPSSCPTCLSASFASIFMGAVVLCGVAMASGMGVNAYLT